MRTVAKYRKFIVALLGALAVVGAEVPPDAPSWLTSVFAVATAVGVLYVRNAQPVTRADLARKVDLFERPRPPRRDDRPGTIP